MGFWGDVAGILTGGAATYHTANALGFSGSSASKAVAATNPAGNDYYLRKLDEDKDKDDGGTGESRAIFTGGMAAYKTAKALGAEDSSWHRGIMQTNPAANDSYKMLQQQAEDKRDEKALNASMQIGAYTPPDLSNPDGAYTLGRR